MKLFAIALTAAVLAACSPSKVNKVQTSENYWQANDSSAILVSGELLDDVVGYFPGAAVARQLTVKFDGQTVAEGHLNDVYEGVLSGTHQGKAVEVSCHYPKVSGQWREVRCSVTVDGSWAASLTF